MARVIRHHFPQLGVVGSAGTGKDGLRTSASAVAVTAAARLPAMPSPIRPTHSATATANPSQPTQFESAPKEMNRAVATTCQTMVWKASSPAIQPQVKLRTVNGSRRMGR